jgi:hypothetical protein
LKQFQEWEEGRIKENDGQGEFKYDILYYNKYCKYHNVPLSAQ